MKPIPRSYRQDMDSLKDSVWLIWAGVYGDYDDICYLAAEHEYDDTTAYVPSKIMSMIEQDAIPDWVTHLVWISK